MSESVQGIRIIAPMALRCWGPRCGVVIPRMDYALRIPSSGRVYCVDCTEWYFRGVNLYADKKFVNVVEPY